MQTAEKKKKLKIPTTCALLFMLMGLAAILTWIIPAGEYDTEKVGNLNRVIAGTYHTIESNPQGFWDLIMAVPLGFTKASSLIFMTMFVGGAVELLEKSGSIAAVFGKIAKRNLNARLIVLLVMAFMTVGGATGVFANPVVALIPIGVLLAKSLGFDSFTGFLMIYMGAYSGFNVGCAVTSTIGTAHPIAELPLFSGMNVRLILHVINFVLCYVFTIRYMESIKKTPTKSLCYEDGMAVTDYMGMESTGAGSIIEDRMTWRHTVSLIALIASIIVLLYGCIAAQWSFNQIAAIFFLLSVFVGLVNGFGIDGTTKIFIQGCAKMANAGFIVGFANGIGIIMTNGQILNTIVYWLSIPMNHFGPIMGANFMFIANLFINLFIPSGSGQAAAVMPIMVPVADLSGITRQVAVQAFQFGDGFSNCLFPTAGTLMGSLAVAKIDWSRYAKWFLPLLGFQTLLAIISLTILQAIGWTGL